MSKAKELAKNTAIIAIGKVCTQFINFFLLPLYTRILSTEEYGTVDLLNTYITLFIPLLTYQIEQALFRYLINARDKEDMKIQIITTAIAFTFLQSLLYGILCYIVYPYIHINYKIFLYSNVIAVIFSGSMLQISRGLGNNAAYSLGSFMTAIVTVLCNVIFIVFWKLGGAGLLLASLIGNVVCTIFIFLNLKIHKYINIKVFELKRLKSMLKYSVPLIPNSISWWIISAADRSIVAAFIGVGGNGLITIATKFSNLYTSMFSIFNLSWTESAALHFNDEDMEEFFTQVIDVVIRIAITSCLGIIAYLPFVFPLLVDDKFIMAYYQIPIYMIAALFSIIVSLYGVIYVALKKTKEVAKTSIYAGIINIIANLILIRYIGIYAASISSMIAYGIMVIYRYYDTQKYIKVHISKKLICYSFLLLLSICAVYYSNILYLQLSAALVISLLILYINRMLIKKILVSKNFD